MPEPMSIDQAWTVLGEYLKMALPTSGIYKHTGGSITSVIKTEEPGGASDVHIRARDGSEICIRVTGWEQRSIWKVYLPDGTEISDVSLSEH